MVNRLAGATSPYLLQHAENPVHWWEWSEDAFAEARTSNRPVLLSVGYAACHWCHVMAHESFEDPTTAALMNEHFVNIKVDREERPDVDAVYMQATQAMTGQGGWPMTVLLTPDGEPFFAGTYFPDQPRHGQPAFRQVLEALASAWQERRDEVDKVATDVAAHLRSQELPAGEQPIDADVLAGAVAALAGDFDPEHAGFGGAPKFPPSMVLEFLFRHAARASGPTADQALRMAAATCAAMARGGMYDQLAGGFARYSVDSAWVVPHFEKMLYDNALLLGVYVHWWRQSGDPLAGRVARETADFLISELRTPEGGFASALDADTEGSEGKYYVWTPDQLVEALGDEDGRWAAELLAVTDTGTFEHGASTLQLRNDPADHARWERVRTRLLDTRARRVRPARDDKVVAAWNGLAVSALAEAGTLLDEPRFVEAAVAAGELLVDVHLDEPGTGLLRVSREGRAGRHAGVLEDYACVAAGFLALLSATGEPRWARRAGGLVDAALARFAADGGGFHDTATDAEELVSRPRDPSDNASPSGQSALVHALLGYSAVTGSGRHRDAAEETLRYARVLAERVPRFAGWWLAAAEAALAGPLEVAVVGDPGDPRREALVAAARGSASPGMVVVVGTPSDTADGGRERIPLLEGRGLVEESPAAYVCRGLVCRRPVTAPDELAELLGA